eukprot:COSAG01_NODE_53236_length_340_cov_2.738589_1_plen_41_part_00
MRRRGGKIDIYYLSTMNESRPDGTESVDIEVVARSNDWRM